MSTNTVSIALKAEGISEAIVGMKTVREAYIEGEAAATAAVLAGSKQRVEIWEKEAAAHDKIVAKVRESERFAASIGRSGGAGRSALSGTRSAGGDGGLGGFEKRLVDRIFGETGKLAAQFGAAGLAVGGLLMGIDLASKALSSFASFVLSDVVKPAWDLETKAQQMSNNSGGAVGAQQLMDRSRAVGIKNNIEAKDVAGAIDLFGDKQKGMDMIDMVATMSKSRGIPLADLAGLAAPLSSKMSTEQMQSLLPSLAAQSVAAKAKGGKSFDLGQMASLNEGWIAPSEHLSGDQNAQVRQMGALMQTSARGFRGVRQASSAVTGFINEAIGSTTLQSKFAGDFTTDKATGATQIGNVGKLIGDIMGATKGGSSASALKALGLGEPAQNLLGNAYGKTYADAAAGVKAEGGSDADASKAGAAAVEEAIRAVVTASGTLKDEEEGRAKVMATTGQQWESAVNQLKDRLLAAMPEINQFVQNFADHGPEIAAAALQLTSALLWVAETIGNIIRGMQKFAGLFSEERQGDVLKTVVNRGGATQLPAMKEPGHWQDTGNGMLDYVRDSSDPAARNQLLKHAGQSRRVGPDGTEVFQAPGAKPDSLFGTEGKPLAVPPPGVDSVLANAVSGAGKPAAATAADGAHESMVKLKASADQTTASISKLGLAIQQAGRNKTLLDS